jgi:hypothetical protein
LLRYGLLDLDFSYEAKRSGDLKGVLGAALDDYVNGAEQYNQCVVSFDATVLELFRRNQFFEAPIHTPTTVQSFLSTYEILDQNKIITALANLRGRPNSAFGIYTYWEKDGGLDPPCAGSPTVYWLPREAH